MQLLPSYPGWPSVSAKAEDNACPQPSRHSQNSTAHCTNTATAKGLSGNDGCIQTALCPEPTPMKEHPLARKLLLCQPQKDAKAAVLLIDEQSDEGAQPPLCPPGLAASKNLSHSHQPKARTITKQREVPWHARLTGCLATTGEDFRCGMQVNACSRVAQVNNLSERVGEATKRTQSVLLGPHDPHTAQALASPARLLPAIHPEAQPRVCAFCKGLLH